MANKFSDIIKNLDEILEGNHLTRMLPERYSSTPTKSFATKDAARTYAQSLVTQFKSYKSKLQSTADRLNTTLTSLLATKNQKNTDTTIKWNMVKVYADVATASYSDFIYNSAGVKRHLMNTNRFADSVYWNTDNTIDDGLWKGMAHWVSPSWGVPWTQYTQLLVSNTEKTKAQALMGAGKTEPGVTTTTVTTTTTTGSGQSSSSSTTTTTTDWYPTPWDCNSGYWDSNAGYWDGDKIDRGWIWGTNGSKGPNQIMLQKADYGHVMMNQMGPLTTQLNKWVQYYKNICQIATLNSAHAIKKYFDEVVTPSVPKRYYDTTSFSRNYDYDFDTTYLIKDTDHANNTYKAQEMVGKFMADYNYNTLPNATSQTVSGTTDEANLVYYGYFDYNNNTTNYTTPGFLSQYMASTSSTTTPSEIARLKSNGIDTLAELLEKYDGLRSYNVITPDSLVTVEQYFYDTLDSVKAGWKAKTGMTLSPYALGTAKLDGSANTTGVASKPDGSGLNTTNGTVNISSDSLAKSTTRNNTRWTNQTSIPSALASSTSTAESPVYAINMTTGATTYVNIPDPDHVITATPTTTNGVTTATNGAPCLVTYQINADTKQMEKMTTASTGAVYGCTSIIIYKRWHQTEWYLCGPNTVPSNAGTESYQYARKFEQNKADFSQYQRLITRLYNDANTILTWALGKYDTDGSVAKYIKAQGGIVSEPWGMIYVVNDYYNWSDDTWLYNFLQYSCRYNKDLMVFKSDILSGSVKPDSNDY